LKNQQARLLLAVILAAPALALADNIPGHSKTGNNYVTFSEGFSEQQDSQGSSARCNFLLGSVKETGANTDSIARASFSDFAKGDKGSNFGALLNTGMDSDNHQVRLFDFGGSQGASSDSDKDKGKGHGKGEGGDGDGNGTGSGSGAPSPVVSVAEPGSQSLLLFGLAGMGIFFYRRKTLTNAI
jgi:hypothetical protein